MSEGNNRSYPDDYSEDELVDEAAYELMGAVNEGDHTWDDDYFLRSVAEYHVEGLPISADRVDDIMERAKEKYRPEPEEDEDQTTLTDGGQPQGRTYHELLEKLAERAAEAAREAQEHREFLRKDPEFVDAQWWLARSRGERNAIAEALGKLYRRQERGRFDPLDFAEWAWDQHIRTNEWRSEATGQTKEAAHGHHHGYYEVLEAVRECTDVEYEDYGDDLVAA